MNSKNKQNILITEIINIIANEVNNYKKLSDPRGCKSKIECKTFIKIFLDKLISNLTWEQLGSIYSISKTHMNNTFIKWSDNGIFKKAFNTFLRKYHLFIDNNEAYIDSTTIFNKYGYINTVGMNTYESKKHKSNKLSIVASKNGIPLGIHISDGNIHDLKLLMDTLPNKTYFNYLYADKSYISKELKTRLLITRNIKIIHPYKINQNNKNTTDEIIGLRNRMRIEHVNNKLKQNKCINTRYIKDLIHFESFIYLGCLKLGLQVVINDFYNF